MGVSAQVEASATLKSPAPLASSLDYNVDTSLLYMGSIPRGGASEANRAPRSLGLRRARIDLDWHAAKATQLKFVLRPDAANRSESMGGAEVREVDTRAGDKGMRQKPTVRLLDAYELAVTPSSQLSFGVGVYESLTESLAAYSETLEFGLEPLFPSKSAGLHLAWRFFEGNLPTAQPRPGGAPLTLDIFALQGDDDRSEELVENSTTADQALGSKDSRSGGAFGVFVSPTVDLRAYLLLGYLDAAKATRGDNLDERHDETFAQLASSYEGTLNLHKMRLGLDAKFLRRKWQRHADRQQISVKATSAVRTSSRVWTLLGFGYGQDDRWRPGGLETVPLTGFMIEGGLQDEVGPNLNLRLLLSYEKRTTREESGAKAGGFGDFDHRRFEVRRAGLELVYFLNGHS